MAAGRFASNGWEDERRCNGLDMSNAQFLSLLRRGLQVQLKEMRREQVRQVLQVAIGKALYCQKHERVNHIFGSVLVENKLSVG